MSLYTKCCAICGKVFETSRMNTVCCGQKCRNKSRSFPKPLLQELIAKANTTIRQIETVPKAVRDFVRKYGTVLNQLEVENSVKHQVGTRVKEQQKRLSQENTVLSEEETLEKQLTLLGISKEEQAVLIETAKRAKEQQNKQEIANNVPVDPEMLGFNERS